MNKPNRDDKRYYVRSDEYSITDGYVYLFSPTKYLNDLDKYCDKLELVINKLCKQLADGYGTEYPKYWNPDKAEYSEEEWREWGFKDE